MSAPPAPVQTRRLSLFGAKGVVGRCRDFTRVALGDWGWFDAPDPAAAEDVLLVVSELVGNACLHAGGPLELVLRLEQERLRVEVSDAAPAPPVPHQGTASQPGGHGLRVVARLTREWGWQPHAVGKAVWAEVDRPDAVGHG